MYGIQLRGMRGANALLVDVDRQCPTMTVVATVRESEPVEERVTDTHADLNLKTGGRVSVDREGGLAEFVVPRPLSDEELIHPYLAPVASVVAHWLRRPCFHAGAFISGGGAWALAGDREAGKSSLLAWLALHGHAVLADDIVVLEDSSAFAGPRSIDLRSDAAAHLDAGRRVGVMGARARWRVALSAIPSQVPFRGWIHLSWGSAVEAESLAGPERLVRLLGQRTLRLVPHDPAAHLALAALPAWEVRRPKDWRLVGEVAERLLALTSSAL